MKKRRGLSLAALLLAATLLLAACGDRDNKDNSQTHNGTNSGVTDNSGTNGSGTDSGANSGTGTGTAGDNAKSRSDANSFQRMLDNARVHDTDGDLTDGENSRW